MNVFPTVVYADFETDIQNAVTTCGQAWKLKHVVSILGRAGGGKYSLCDSAGSTERKTLS